MTTSHVLLIHTAFIAFLFGAWLRGWMRAKPSKPEPKRTRTIETSIDGHVIRTTSKVEP